MAENMYTHIPVEDEAGKHVATLYSRDGKERSVADFSNALSLYEKTGQAPEGFIALPAGWQQRFRDRYMDVTGAIPKVAAGIGKVAGSSPGMVLLNKMGVIPQEAMPSVTKATGDAGQGIGSFIQDQIRTPEQGAAVGIGAASGIASGGLSLLSQAGAVGIGAGLGRVAGSLAYQGKPELNEAAMEALVQGSLYGAFGVVRWVIGKGMSSDAAKGVAEDIVNIFKKKYPAFMNDETLFAKAMESPEIVSTIVQTVQKGLGKDVQATSDMLVNSIKQITRNAPRTISNKAVAQIREQAEQFATLGGKLISNVDDAEAMKATKGELSVVLNNMRDTLLNEFKPSSKTLAQVKANPDQRTVEMMIALHKNVNDQIKRYTDGAEVIGALKRSGQGSGFNVQALQQELRGIYQSGGSMLRDVGLAAGRGAELTSGVDRNIIPSLPLPRWIAPGVRTPSFGKSYVGKVHSTLPDIAATITGRPAMREILGADR